MSAVDRDREEMASDGSCEGLAASIQAKISTSSPQFSARDCCIYRVPPLLRQHNEKAYTPAVVSIGPLHHNDSRLLPMESHKLPYLESFLRDSPPNMNLSSYLRIVKELETDIRRCYADLIHLSSDDFIQVVLINSIFLIDLFRRYSNPYLIQEDDYIYRRSFIMDGVERDMKLEENQLPLFVLVRLYRAAFKSDPSLDEKKGILRIPKLELSDETEYLFRNLIAFEQCHYCPNDTLFSSYSRLWNELIETPNDVELLVKEGIIQNMLGSNKQVCDFINSIGDNVTINSEYYHTITQQLNSYSQKKWNSNKAALRQKYFQNPWAAISVIYAAILLLLTAIQVVAAILAIPHLLKGT